MCFEPIPNSEIRNPINELTTGGLKMSSVTIQYQGEYEEHTRQTEVSSKQAFYSASSRMLVSCENPLRLIDKPSEPQFQDQNLPYNLA
jgi:hypothetical protein